MAVRVKKGSCYYFLVEITINDTPTGSRIPFLRKNVSLLNMKNKIFEIKPSFTFPKSDLTVSFFFGFLKRDKRTLTTAMGKNNQKLK